jgi:hypothetical protein
MHNRTGRLVCRLSSHFLATIDKTTFQPKRGLETYFFFYGSWSGDTLCSQSELRQFRLPADIIRLSTNQRPLFGLFRGSSPFCSSYINPPYTGFSHHPSKNERRFALHLSIDPIPLSFVSFDELKSKR